MDNKKEVIFCAKKIDSIRLVYECLYSDVTIKYIAYDDYESCEKMYNIYEKMCHFVNLRDDIIVKQDFSAIKDLIDLFCVNIRWLGWIDDIEFKLNSLLDIVDEMMLDNHIAIEKVEKIVEIIEEIKCIYEKIYSFDILLANDVSIISLENVVDYKDDYIVIYDISMDDNFFKFDFEESNVLELATYELYNSGGGNTERYNIWLTYLDTPNKDKLRGFIVGMSYIQVGTNLARFKYPTASLAAPTQDIFYDFEMLKYVYNNGANNLDYVIIEVNPYKLWYDMSLSEVNKFRALYYVPQTGTTHNLENGSSFESYFEAKSELYNELFEKDYIRLSFEEMILKKGLYGKPNTNIAHYSTMDEYNGAKVKVEKLFDKDYPHTYEENKEILRNMLEFCKARNIHAIVVMPPFPTVFKDNMNQKMYKCTVEYLNELKNSYSAVSVLDYTFCELFDDYYFYDCDHLNYFGSNLLTDLLNIEIERIIGMKE